MLEMDSPTRHILLLQIKDGIDSAAENQQRKYRCVAYFGIIRWGWKWEEKEVDPVMQNSRLGMEQNPHPKIYGFVISLYPIENLPT